MAPVLGRGGGAERAVYAVPGHPTGLAVGGGQVWAAAPGSGAITVLDARTGRRTGASVRTGGAPARLALGANGVWVADTARGAVLPISRDGSRSYAPIRLGSDVADVALAARAVWAISSAEGVVRTLEPGAARVRKLPVGRHPVDIAADARWVAVASASDRTLTWIDAPARRVAGHAHVGGEPAAVTVTGDIAWVADAAGDAVTRVDLRAGTVGRAIPVGGRPIAVAADGDEVYVLCADDGKLWNVEADGDVAWTRAVGKDPAGLALDENNVWIADHGGDEVIRIER